MRKSLTINVTIDTDEKRVTELEITENLYSRCEYVCNCDEPVPLSEALTAVGRYLYTVLG